MKTNPPKLPLRFFRWYCHPKMLKYIEGDLTVVRGAGKEAQGINPSKASMKIL